MEDVPVFTADALLNATCDDRELAAQVVEVFVADIPGQLDDLAAAVRAGDAKTAERAAHSIKGASATVGGQRMRLVAFECETMGREGRLDDLGGKIAALRAAFAELLQAMQEAGFAARQ